MNRLMVILVTLILLLSPAFALAEESCAPSESVCEVDIESGTAVSNPFQITHHEDHICIVYFYGNGCSKCALTEPLIREMEEKYGDLIEVYKLEVYDNLANFQLYNQFCSIQEIPVEQRGVPFLVIDDKYFMGANQIRDNLESEIGRMIDAGEMTCPVINQEGQTICEVISVDQGDVNPLIPGLTESVSLPLVIGAGLIDGINPCAFAVLIFLLTFLLEISDNRKRMVKAGSVYIAAVYMTYLIAGLGLLSAIQYIGAGGIVMYAAAAVAIIAGLINIKDYFWYGKGISLQIPEGRKPMINRWISKANVPAALVLGFLVSMFELPCTGGIYLAIIAMLASSVTSGLAAIYLIIYNIFFILPLIIIFALVVRGMSAERIEKWRTSKKNWMKLAMGIILLLLGLILLSGAF